MAEEGSTVQISDIINNTDGVVFIYTNYISSGVIPLILALEYNGYRKYNSQEILKYPEYNDKDENTKCDLISYDGYRKNDPRFKTEEFIGAKYAVITGSNDTLNLDIENLIYQILYAL